MATSIKTLAASLLAVTAVATATAGHGGQAPSRRLTIANGQFVLDGKPFQIISGEMHPARIPVEYWRHRIQMAKAMGRNTIAAYAFGSMRFSGAEMGSM